MKRRKKPEWTLCNVEAHPDGFGWCIMFIFAYRKLRRYCAIPMAVCSLGDVGKLLKDTAEQIAFTEKHDGSWTIPSSKRRKRCRA